MITGETLTSTTPTYNPVRRAFELEWHQGPNIGRSSWDEVLKPHLLDQRSAFEKQFKGMSAISFTYEDFEATRERLVKDVN